ncbi:MAG: phosphatase PAP2 family protein [Myxococcales bacterium]|nr:phosphatase PAP2 family protein [Myxococcales bacterium]
MPSTSERYLSVASAGPRGFLAAHDWIALAYLVIMRGLLVVTDAHAEVALRLDASLVVLLAGCALRAAPWQGPTWTRARTTLYRLALVFVVLQSYLSLRDLLPILRSDSVDATLLAIDRALLGETPAIWLQRLNVRPLVEWFSFFYFSYFVICGFFITMALWGLKDHELISRFAIGSLLVLFIGQLGYVAVPGFGPVRELAQAFAAPLDGGPMWGLVDHTVAQAGAMKDIFPSLHTALPTWFSLFAFQAARRDPRFKTIAPITAFFAANIVVSTMFLRWHYAIDVAVGLALAITASFVAPRIAALEQRIRAERRLDSPWA